ncbi:transposase [Streptomyces sp. WG7]|uniref:transposase n=1 Tax=Streptomyces sp. WG7 TaxID=3417650 RepID=UPI003CEB874A
MRSQRCRGSIATRRDARELYLPKPGTPDRERCRASGVPDTWAFATKTESARSLLARTLTSLSPIAGLTADVPYGQAWHFRRMLEAELRVADSHWAIESCFKSANALPPTRPPPVGEARRCSLVIRGSVDSRNVCERCGASPKPCRVREIADCDMPSPPTPTEALRHGARPLAA